MKVLLCSFFKFPNGCAGAVRHEKWAQMLMHMGHEVFVVGIGKANHFQTETHKSIPYTSLRYGGTSTADKIKTRLRYWQNLKTVLQQFQPDAVLMDDMRPYVTKKLKRYTKQHGMLLIHDSVEWYSKEQFQYGALSPLYIQKNTINRKLIDRSCRVIGISQYLTDHFTAKGLSCVNIPIVVADDDLVEEKTLQPTMQIVYAGQAGKKDYLHVMLEAMALLTQEERALFTFHVLGCTKEQLAAMGVNPTVLQTIESSLVMRGRVTRDEVLETLKSADFTVLMRSPTLRYAKAGFPTKAVESLSHSTPIIANLTSDLHRYLVDGVNALIVEDCTPEALAKVLKKAIRLTVDEREQLCKNAYNTAAKKLHFTQFIPAMNDILK